MHRLVAVIWLSLATLCQGKEAISKDGECGARRISSGTVFTLVVEGSITSSREEFKLCERESPEQSFLLVKKERFARPRDRQDRKVPLSKEAFSGILVLYEAALAYNAQDTILGVDGETWCLETRRGFNYSLACFWEPKHQAQSRGLGGLVNLEADLRRLSKTR